MRESVGFHSFNIALSQESVQLDFMVPTFDRAMSCFLSQAGPGDILIFRLELLTSSKCYARQFRLAGDVLVEETDRYEQALLHNQLAIECFSQAKLSILKNGLV